MKPLRFGDVTVERLVEAEGPGFYPAFILPGSDQAAIDAERGWLEPHFFDPASGRFIMSVHSYVIRTRHHVILVDTCVGNDKNRPSTKPWHQQQTPWLENLAAIGVAPEQVDVVLCTHLHVDHVGWNTKLEDGRWVPTFANAKYLFHRDEYAFWESEADDSGGAGAGDGCFRDSVLPVMEAGQAVLVAGDHAIDDTMHLEPSYGHSPGHVCLHLETNGADGRKHAVFSGDLMHHPVQCTHPDWNSRFCHDPARSRATRRGFVDRLAESDTLVLAAHFAQPTVGRIVAKGGRCRFEIYTKFR